MSASQWFYLIDGQQYGPVPMPDLKHEVFTGRLRRSDLVWRDGFKDWTPAWQVQGLFSDSGAAVSPGRLAGQIPAPSEAYMTSIQQPMGAEITYAGFWKRFAALFVDGFILMFAVLPVFFVITVIDVAASGGSDPESAAERLAPLYYMAGILIRWLYFTLMESSPTQATLGKMALNIKVTDLNGNRIGFGRANGRYFGKIVSFIIFCIGFIMAAFTDKKQALHDIMAGCLVIDS